MNEFEQAFKEYHDAFIECMEAKKEKFDIEIKERKAHTRLNLATSALFNLKQDLLSDFERTQ